MNELSYDRFHKNYENIYRVKVVGQMSGGVLDQAVTCAPLASTLLKDYPEVVYLNQSDKDGSLADTIRREPF